ncbi:MAG: ribosome silencing factor [Clostridia bacterium]|nr:ribosome silencing factor [Clostridia bacterium]
MTAIEKALKAAAVLDEKKGRDVKVLKVREETVITDYFVIATATSSTHLKALCDEVEYRLREEDGVTADRVEGYQSSGWILVDFGDVIVHIFDANGREFFKLEKLWSGAESVDFVPKED